MTGHIILASENIKHIKFIAAVHAVALKGLPTQTLSATSIFQSWAGVHDFFMPYRAAAVIFTAAAILQGVRDVSIYACFSWAVRRDGPEADERIPGHILRARIQQFKHDAYGFE